MTINLTKYRYVVTRNLAGYMPESDPIICRTFAEACDAIAEDMRWYASEDDEAAYAELLADVASHSDYPEMEDGTPDFGDDYPSMLATVEAILKDDSPESSHVGESWNAWVEDGRGRTIVFSLTKVAVEDCDPSFWA